MAAKGPHGQQFEAYRPVIMGRASRGDTGSVPGWHTDEGNPIGFDSREGEGNEFAIRVDVASGALQGACDPRRDGYAIGY